MEEFDSSVKLLQDNDVEVIVLNKQDDPELEDINIPDAVFPNWFTTYENGVLALFQMKYPNRQDETRMLGQLKEKLADYNYDLTLDYRV